MVGVLTLLYALVHSAIIHDSVLEAIPVCTQCTCYIGVYIYIFDGRSFVVQDRELGRYYNLTTIGVSNSTIQ